MFYRLIYITILIIELIECVFGVNYVDVKNYNISRGVNVFHGRFNKFGKYFMFVGDLEPITQLRFGNELIFPSDTGSKNYNLFVEMFIKNNLKLVSFYVHTFHKGLLKEVKRKVISISCDTYSYIRPKPKHPFVTRLISEYSNSYLKTCKFINDYKGFIFDGISSPRYIFGYVYDSNHPAVVGYTMYPYLIDECFSITTLTSHFNFNILSKRFYEISVIETSDNNVQKYEMRPILGEECWFLIEYTNEMISNEAILNAIKLYKFYSNNKVMPFITLDISELASPEIFGIEKVTGLTGIYTYKMFKLKEEFENNCKIRMVIDPTIRRRNIFIQKKKYIKYNVEVYRNIEETYVFNRYSIKIGDIIMKELIIYKKGTYEEQYVSVIQNAYKQILKMIDDLHPIKLDITIDKEQPSLFEKKEISNKEFTIYHFSINETNDFGESILNKYVFGRVFRTTSFELGNIPQEPFRKHRVMIVGDINTNKFIVRNKSTLDNLSTPQYQLFRLRT